MSEHKSIFRTVLDAMIESRARQAEREVAYYRPRFAFDGKTPSSDRS